MILPKRPLTILIGALGGEGGGVLTNWLVDAAAQCGFPVQSTSIPGVAQRTGSTTYYIEIVPVDAAELAGKRPVLALVPGIGDIDLMVASELLEASRAVANGFVTRERTIVLTSTHRAYVMTEKMAMGDGRLNSGRLLEAIGDNAQGCVAFDMDALARRHSVMISAVMLGAIAGIGKLPIPADAFEAVIGADGTTAEANRRGFRAGLQAAQDLARPAEALESERAPARVIDSEPFARDIAAMARAAQEVASEGTRRLVAYQDARYARMFLDRLRPIQELDARWSENGRLLTSVARHLAVRMSFEDVIRVAQAKSDPRRFARIRSEKGIGEDDPYIVVDYLKPGVEELCSLLPPGLARSVLRIAEQRGWLGRVHFGMEVKSTSVLGYLRFWTLAKLRRVRRRTYRYQQEQAAIEAWLAQVRAAGEISADLAREIADCARLIKGYGDTYQLGVANYALIETHLIRPALAGRLAPLHAIDAIASARTAALADPDGTALAQAIAEAERAAARNLAAE